MTNYIPRTLTKNPGAPDEAVIAEDQIAAIQGPIVIIGDPGIGKTSLTKSLADKLKVLRVAAGTFYRIADPLSLDVLPDDTIIIDGLDEIATSSGTSAVDEVLSKLSCLKHPRFILSCRAADWDAAESKFKIKQDYGVEPVTLHLQPFSRDEALSFLNQYENIDAEIVLTEIDDRGLAELYGNPLTLELFAEIAAEGHGLPDSRAELFEKATKLLVAEKNPLHAGSATAKAQVDGLLDSAGAIFAHLLLSGTIGIATGPRDDVPDGFVSDTEIQEIPEAPYATGVIATRLFRSDGECLLIPIHRVIAEYLGARWLGKRLDDGFSQRRLFQHLVIAGGVPGSLRGLHAWLGHFGPSVANRCIRTDPFGILRYGNTSGMPFQRAQLLLKSLEELAEDDPYFRSEDWGKQAIEGLTRPELKDDIVSLITGSNRHLHLSSLLLEAMAESRLADEITPELLQIMNDTNVSYKERISAADALIAGKAEVDWASIVSELSNRGENNDGPLSLAIISRRQGQGFTGQKIGDAIIKYFGLSSKDDSDGQRFSVAYSLPRGLSPELSADILDSLAALISKADKPRHWNPGYELSSIIHRLLDQVISGGAVIGAEQLWSWIRFLGRGQAGPNVASENITEYFKKNIRLRREIQQIAFSDTEIEANPWMAIVHVLPSIGLGVALDVDDKIFYLYQIAEQDSLSEFDFDLWKDLVQSCRTNEGVESVFLESIEAGAERHKKLRKWWDDFNQLPEPEWKIKQRERTAKYEKEKLQRFGRARKDFLAIRDKIEAGAHIGALQSIAKGYFNLYLDLREEPDPVLRLRDWLGDELTEVALAGFSAALTRDDLPTAEEIAKSHADNKVWNFEFVILCGIAELVRTGQSLIDLPPAVIEAALASWWHIPVFNSEKLGDEIKKQLESAVFRSDESTSRFLTSVIEPHIRAERDHVPGLYQLPRDDRFKRVAGPLALSWLRLYPSTPSMTQFDLLETSIGLATIDELTELVRERLIEIEGMDAELRRIWVSAAFLIDFEESGGLVSKLCKNDPKQIWSLRRLINPRRLEGLSQRECSLRQLEFLVRRFAPEWPLISPPSGGWSGETNPWDATDFITGCIVGIAGDSSEAASTTLDELAQDATLESYSDQIKHARAQQRKLRRDKIHEVPSFNEVKHSLAGDLPGNVDDLKALILDHLDDVQDYIRNSDTKSWEAYWNLAKKRRGKTKDDKRKDEPKDENTCRNRLLDDLRPRMPTKINLLPESLMPEDKRVDIIALIDGIGLPIEIKGQWHKDVWEASKTQLDDKYTRDWRAGGRGIYLVLWFGNVPDKNLPKHPADHPRSTSPSELKKMLDERLTPSERARIDIVVLDVSQPG